MIMAMTDEVFIALVKRLEGEAARRPRRYKLRVLLLALLGYVYILGILAGTLALLVLLLLYGRFSGGTVKIEIVLLTFAALILRALWVRLPPPQGLPLERRDAPALFAELDRLRASLRTPPIHQVLLTADLNASMSQVPRLGVLGWQKNYLTIGLPLMQALSPAGFRAVLAHELGHLSRTHSRFAGWIYRVRKTWDQLLEELAKRQHRGAALFKRFFAWYAPFFGACSFVLARAQEYEADRLAAVAAGTREAAQALLSVAMAGDFLARDFWPAFFQRASAQPRPDDAVREVGHAVGEGTWREPAGRMARVVDEETDVHDSHPCLRDRLAALGEEPALPAPPEESAAERYLGPALPTLAERLASDWTRDIAPAWQQRYEEAQRERERLTVLEEKSRAQRLDAEESFEQALLTESLSGGDAALPLYRAVLDIEPRHAGASFQLGRLLLEREDPEGARWLEAAMQHDAGFNLVGSQILAAFWRARGEADRARAHRQKAEQEMLSFEEARQERATFRRTDPLVEHGLPAEAVSDLAAQLRQLPQVKAAYLARKETPLSADQPLYVLAVVYNRQSFRSEGYFARLNKIVVERLRFPGDTFVVSFALLPAKTRRRLRRMGGSRVL